MKILAANKEHDCGTIIVDRSEIPILRRMIETMDEFKGATNLCVNGLTFRIAGSDIPPEPKHSTDIEYLSPSNLIRELKKVRNWSIKECATALHVSSSAVHTWMNGRTKIYNKNRDAIIKLIREAD